MKLFNVDVDWGKRKRFARGCLAEIYDIQRIPCSACGVELYRPCHNQLFADKDWNVKMHMDRSHYADFADLFLRSIILAKIKKILLDNFNNSVDFADIEMISFRDLSPSYIKYYRAQYGSRDAKLIPNDPPQYFRLLLKQGADLDFEKSNVEMILSCSTCGSKKYKHPISDYNRETNEITYPPVYIIESSWKGYDIFYVEGKGNTVFCTERFIEVYNQNKLTGLEFRQIFTS